MTIILFACLNGECPTIYFRTTNGRCPGCGAPGYRVGWALKPPRRMWLPPDEGED